MKIERLRAAVGKHGWGLARGLPFVTEGRADTGAMLAIASMLGRPSSRDGGVPIWPVRPRSGDPTQTFSMRTGPADFHTDAQYRPDPEDLVCLFVVRPAGDGGDTLLLPLHKIIDWTHRIRELREPRWTWEVPGAFAAGGHPAVPRAVLPDDGTIRWRSDNLSPSLPGELRRAAASFTRRLASARGKVEIRQRPGDLIVIDNRRTLHARTAFDDPDRLLFRVRLWAGPGRVGAERAVARVERPG